MSLFQEENYRVNINPEIKLIAPFRRLMNRDEDKHKRNALKELAYVYFMADYKSPYMAYSEMERGKTIAKHIELSNDFEHDSDIEKAIQMYKELNETPSIRTLKSVRGTLLTTNTVIDKLRLRIEGTLKTYEEDPDANPQMLLDIVAALKGLLELGDKIPKTITTLENLQEKVEKEKISGTKIIGGGDVGDFED